MEDKRLLLVPVNFTHYAENGALYALNLAHYLEANIVLLHCYLEPVMAVPGLFEPFTYSTLFDNMKTLEKDIEINLKALKETLEKEKSKHSMDKVSISYDLVHGFPSSSILAYAEQMEADAIVLGFENESDRLKFGNITNAVIEHAKIPVIAVPQHYKASVFKKPEKILYFTQIDELDAEAIERLIRLVSFFKAQIICVHACLGESTEEEEQKMHELKNTLEKHYDSDLLECGILETGDIIEGVVKFVKKRQVDVLAMNTKKRHALLKLFTSNFTEKVLDQTHVPLLVFHVNRS